MMNSQQPPAGLDRRLRARVVLVADDDQSNREVFRAVLEGHGYTVACAENGDEALEIVRERTVDVALLDVVMPGRTGLEVCHAIKTDPTTRLIPVVLVTGAG